MNWYLNYLLRRHWGGEKDLSWIWWVKCILGYSPAGEGVEKTTETQRTQRSIAPIWVKLITPRIRESKIYLLFDYNYLIYLL